MNPINPQPPSSPQKPAAKQPLSISWDELNTESIDQKIQQQQAISETRAHYDSAKINAPVAKPRKSAFTFLYNTLVYMTAFGLLGGLLGWSFGIILHLRPNLQAESRELIVGYEQMQRQTAVGRWTPQEAERQLRQLRVEGRANPFFSIYIDDKLSSTDKQQKLAALKAADASKDFIANVLFYGIAGLFISACLAMAESVVDRNWPGAVIYGSVGAALGIGGGVAVAFLIDHLHHFIVGDNPNPDYMTQVTARSIEWGVLGMFLTIAPGILLQNRKRLTIGLIGGAVGGLIGGLLFLPIAQAEFVINSFNNPQLVSRLIGLLAIGAIAGLATGLIEQAVKTGWVKVIDGVIAGKQFVIYRNPTYIGSSPVSHIYLFKDPLVGKRHAAIHITKSGCEIEDLPLGARTQVNGQPVSRVRLRNNDQVKIGKTTFVYQEKNRE